MAWPARARKTALGQMDSWPKRLASSVLIHCRWWRQGARRDARLHVWLVVMQDLMVNNAEAPCCHDLVLFLSRRERERPPSASSLHLAPLHLHPASEAAVTGIRKSGPQRRPSMEPSPSSPAHQESRPKRWSS